MARTNCGMATPLTASTVPVVSIQVLGLRLAMMPRGKARRTAKTTPSARSSRVTGSLWIKSVVTRARVRIEVPRSPLTTLPSHFRYWT